jgi:hypothetical protein
VLAQAAKQMLAQGHTGELHAPAAVSSSAIRPSNKVTLRAENACCKSMFLVFQMFHLDVASVLCGFAKVDRDVTYVLQWLYTNVASVFSKCFSCFSFVCCSGYIRMLQVYVPNVSPISYVCCKCHMLGTYVAVIIHICCKLMFQLFHLVSVRCNR